MCILLGGVSCLFYLFFARIVVAVAVVFVVVFVVFVVVVCGAVAVYCCWF